MTESNGTVEELTLIKGEVSEIGPWTHEIEEDVRRSSWNQPRSCDLELLLDRPRDTWRAAPGSVLRVDPVTQVPKLAPF